MSQQQVFGNALLLDQILSFVELKTVKKLRLVCKYFGDAGFYVLKRNRDKFHLKLEETSFRGENSEWVESENNRILDWAIKPENALILSTLKLPIHEGMRSVALQNVLREHGHKIIRLRLVRRERGRGEEIVFNDRALFNTPYAFVDTLISSWCPNLQHLSIVDLFVEEKSPEFIPPEFSETKLQSLELVAIHNVFDQLPCQFPREFVAHLIASSPNLKKLKCDYSSGSTGEGVIKIFKENPEFCSNIEVLEHGSDIDISQLEYLTKERFPRLKKLVIDSKRQSIFALNLLPPPAVHFGVKEVIWSSFFYFNHSLPILLSLFPNLEALTVDNVGCYYDANRTTFNFHTRFPSVKKLTLKCNDEVMCFPRVLAELLEMMPGVERLATVGITYLRVILKGTERGENLKELDLTLGQKPWYWIKQDVLDRFPKNWSLNLHE